MIDRFIIWLAKRRGIMVVDREKYTRGVMTVRNLHNYGFTNAHFTTLRKAEKTHRRVQVRIKKKIMDGLGAARNDLIGALK